MIENRKSFLGSARARSPITLANSSNTAPPASHRLSRECIGQLSQMRIFPAAPTNKELRAHRMLSLFAIWLLLSGLDDLFLDFAFLYRWLLTACLGRRGIRAPTEADLAGAPRKRIAVFVSLWREH